MIMLVALLQNLKRILVHSKKTKNPILRRQTTASKIISLKNWGELLEKIFSIVLVVVMALSMVAVGLQRHRDNPTPPAADGTKAPVIFDQRSLVWCPHSAVVALTKWLA